MAVNKRKVLEAARKYAQKGAKDKALKGYNQLLKLDPRDAKLHLEIGDAYRRWGQLEEAVAQYVRVAEQYQQEGFDARAVAVFKQILNLDPKRYATYVSLAELYQHMGLDSEAVGALQTAADRYHKEGQRREALDLLRRMAALDPTNTTSRMKVGDLLHREGMDDDAVAEYEGVAEELLRAGAIDSLLHVYERVLEIQPERVNVLVAASRNLIERKNPEGAEPFAKRALAKGPDEPEHYELLCDIYKTLDKVEELIDTTRSLAKLYRERGDEERAREVIQRLPAGEAIGGDDQPELSLDEMVEEQPALDQFELSNGELSDSGLEDDREMSEHELLEDANFFESEGPVVDRDLDGEEDLSIEEPLEGDGPADANAESSTAETSGDQSLSEGDPDQLLAEASVYLRYGKTEQAIASLQAALAQVPGHRAALEKLGEAFAESDQSAQAVEIWVAAALRAGEEGDHSAVAVLRDRVACLDPAAAARIELPEESATEDVASDVELTDVESDLAEHSQEEAEPTGLLESSAEGLDMESADASAESHSEDIDIEIDASDFDHPALEESVEFDVEFDLDSDDAGTTDPGEAETGGASVAALEIEENELLDESQDGLGASGPIEIELDSDELDLDVESETAAASQSQVDPGYVDPSENTLSSGMPNGVTSASASLSASAATTQQIKEDLEESEFYFQQALYDEAEVIYRRILSVAPNHPSAMLRIGEIAAVRGDAPSTTGDSAASLEVVVETDAPDAEVDDDELSFEEPLAADATSESDLDLSAAEPELSSEPEVESSSEPEVEVAEPASESVEYEPEAESDDDSTLDTELEAEPLVASAAPERSDDQTLPMRRSSIEVDDAEEAAAEVAPQEASGEPEAPAQAAEEDDSFDFAAELRDELEEDDARAESGESPSGTEDVAFESVFHDFKKGVSETLSEGDHETRYDLGIAYREMELYDDAIGEFARCLESPERRLDSLCMLALCALDLDRAADAVSHLEQGLAMPEVDDPRRAGIHFDLGRSFQRLDESERARGAFEAVIAIDPDYPGVAEALAGLGEPDAGSDPEAELEDGGECFEDLIAEAEADNEDVDGAEEPGEVFESFDDLVTDDPDFGPSAADDGPAEATTPENAGDSGSEKPARKKKKISFV